MSATLSPARATPIRQRTPRWWRDVVGIACWASVLIVIALWLSGRGAQLLAAGPADLFTSLGRISGLVAADLLLVQVILMARVPMIERSYGQDELARRHRLVGFASFDLLILHIGLILVGYTLRDHNDLLHETWSVITSYGGMLLAVGAVIALTGVVVTSVRVARRTLRYESWHLLHLYAYVGVGLSVPHEIWTGADFATSSLTSVYWWTIYAAALMAVVTYRLGLPLWRSVRHGITVSSVVRESPDVVSVHLTGRRLHRLPVRAGQYFVFRFLDGAGWSRGNPYSLSATPSPRQLRVTARRVGDGSRRLAQLKPGTKVLIEGPYGRLTGERRVTSKVAMLACGIGITPLRALLEELDYAAGDAVLVYRARASEDLVFRAELDELAARRGITVHYVLGPRIRDRSSWLPQGASGWTDAVALQHLIPPIDEYDVFVCGPDQWMDAACTAALEAGLPPDQLHQERFSW